MTPSQRRYYERNRDKVIAKSQSEYYSLSPEERKLRTFSRHLGSRYKISKQAYLELVRYYDGKCAICAKRKPLDIDHDHTTETVRGLVCRKCNLFLAFLETEGLLRAAVSYLNKYGVRIW